MLDILLFTHRLFHYDSYGFNLVTLRLFYHSQFVYIFCLYLYRSSMTLYKSWIFINVQGIFSNLLKAYLHVEDI